MKQEITNNTEDLLSSDLKHLILYQREQLIKHIAKVKGWDEKELLKDFLNDSNCLENNLKDNLINIVMQDTEKKKSNQSYMDINTNTPDSDTESVKSIIVSDSSSPQSLDNQIQTNRKKKLTGNTTDDKLIHMEEFQLIFY